MENKQVTTEFASSIITRFVMAGLLVLYAVLGYGQGDRMSIINRQEGIIGLFLSHLLLIALWLAISADLWNLVKLIRKQTNKRETEE